MSNLNQSGEKNNRYIDGRTLSNHYCINCGKKIGYNSWYYGNKLCRSCSHKGLKNPKHSKWMKKNNPFKNKYHTEKSRNIISKKTKLRFKDPRNHPNWQNGSSFEPYPLGWTNTYREQIRFRDGYKCQICGCPEVECNRKLHVHHIDYNKININPDNLISLCQNCHMKTNFNRNYWIKILTKK